MPNRRDDGGIILEAAVVLPVILLLAAFFLAQIRSVRYETLVTYALDQTAEEAALLIPLGDAILDGIGISEVADTLTAWLPGDALSEQLLIMAADVSSSLLFGSFIHSRIDFWLDEATAATGFRLPPFEKKLALFWHPDGHGLMLSLSYDVRTAFFSRRALAKSFVPLWTAGYAARGTEAEDREDKRYDPIWEMSNFDRGAKFRTLYGANLPFSYPVIAAFNGNEAVAIKSMDLTAPSYTQASGAIIQIEQHARILSGFDGVVWDGYTILPGQIQSRVLRLVIPENAPAYADSAFFDNAAQRLRLYGVTLEVNRHGPSGRYADLNGPGE